MVEIKDLGLPGCHLIGYPIHKDKRGILAKPFHAPTFRLHNLPVSFGEDFFSGSHRDVLRGFHVMGPPHDGGKLVYPIKGRIMDVALDLRKSLASYGRNITVELDAQAGQAIFLGRGVAHAFLVLSDYAVIGYKTEGWHESSCDLGVHWNSAGVQWPCENPIISPRDRELVSLDKFESPFQ
ncbi:MAG: dTDP-4-dehydrorhamnose 3,5-epimerase family protein [Synechococcus sp. ELA057]